MGIVKVKDEYSGDKADKDPYSAQAGDIPFMDFAFVDGIKQVMAFGKGNYSKYGYNGDQKGYPEYYEIMIHQQPLQRLLIP